MRGGEDLAEALFRRLEGHWRVTRAIDDRRAAGTARFEGEARFAPDGAGLTYAEDGALHLSGRPPLAASRRHLWRVEAGRVVVRFADGRDFHAFDPAAHRPAARHGCPPDVYDVTYDFRSWPVWRVVWQVRGPRKDYRMTTRYAPA